MRFPFALGSGTVHGGSNDAMYLFVLGLLSNRLGDILYVLASVFCNFLIWETRTYYSSHISTQSECERLLAKINRTYWFSTHCRTYLHKELTPTGLVVGDGGYIVYIHHRPSEDKKHDTRYQEQYNITLYGWWTLQYLLTAEVMAPQETGEYHILRCINQHAFWKTRDSYDPAHFHPNCAQAAEILLPCLERDKRGVFFLHGAPGLGKTTTARFLAKQLDATLCLDFEEFASFHETFVHSFEVMYDYVQPTAQHPLVVTLDELEGFVLHNESYDGFGNPISSPPTGGDGEANHATTKYTWRYKNTKKRWVRLMDSIQEKHHVVFVLTSNLPKSFFDAFDPALLREYRITHCLHYTPEGVMSESLAPAVPPTPPVATSLGPTKRVNKGAANKKGRN